jgi:hypothetical protein
MSHVFVHVVGEGDSEKNFGNGHLKDYLSNYSVYVDARCVCTSRDRKRGKKFSGGLDKFQKAKNDILAWIKEDERKNSYFTTMFDYFRLPHDFPGYEEAQKLVNPYDKVKTLEEALKKDIGDHRFIPYIQLHEFEALIFVKPEELEIEYFDYEEGIRNLCRVKAEKVNPELINDGPETAPSKRILKEIEAYDKANVGPEITRNIGMETLKKECCHFSEWINSLEKLGAK